MNLEMRSIEIPMEKGTCDSYVTYPSQGGPSPAVLLYMDGFGPRPYLFEMAQQLARMGYYVLVPNLLYRATRAPIVHMQFPLRAADMPKARDIIMPLVQSFDAAKAMVDAGRFLKFLSEQKSVKAGPVGITGYCMGGGLAVRTAAAYPERVAAVASFHSGQLASDKPDSPHLLLNQIRAELYFGHADNDASMPTEQITRLDEALAKSALKYKVEMFKGAVHGFTMADLPAGNSAAIEKHWMVLKDLFGRTLLGRG